MDSMFPSLEELASHPDRYISQVAAALIGRLEDLKREEERKKTHIREFTSAFASV